LSKKTERWYQAYLVQKKQTERLKRRIKMLESIICTIKKRRIMR